MGRLSPRDPLRTAQRARVMIAGLLAAGVLSAGCVATIEPDAGAQPTSGSVAPATSARPSTDAAHAGSDAGSDTRAEVMRMPLVGGGEIDLAAYLDKPLLLWFWAPY